MIVINTFFQFFTERRVPPNNTRTCSLVGADRGGHQSSRTDRFVGRLPPVVGRLPAASSARKIQSMSRLSRLFHEQLITDLSFQDLRAQLSQCEPRVASLLEIADQVFFRSATAWSGKLRSGFIFTERPIGFLSQNYCQLLEEIESTFYRRCTSACMSSTPTGRGASPGAGYSP